MAAKKKNEKAVRAKIADLRSLSADELRGKLAEQRRELMNARVSSMPRRSLKRLPSSKPCGSRLRALRPY